MPHAELAAGIATRGELTGILTAVAEPGLLRVAVETQDRGSRGMVREFRAIGLCVPIVADGWKR